MPAAGPRRRLGRGLRYASDRSPGIRRLRRGRQFAYALPSGKLVRGRRTLARIRGLAIPPAWTDVWICSDPHGHLQAVGRDARGRKQYLYHADWREIRDQAKFDRMAEFGTVLPRIRRRCRQDMARPGLPREKVVATVVVLLERTLVRVGNEEYAVENASYGLTTLRSRHAVRTGSQVRFRFKGKTGRQHDVEVDDVRISRIVRHLEELPGQELFQYVDAEGDAHSVSSDDVNRYLAEVAGNGFTAKDFRTWAAGVLALRFLQKAPPGAGADARRHVTAVVGKVAQELGNKPAVCRKSYIHPAIISAYLEGSLEPGKLRFKPRPQPAGLRKDELVLLSLLKSEA